MFKLEIVINETNLLHFCVMRSSVWLLVHCRQSSRSGKVVQQSSRHIHRCKCYVICCFHPCSLNIRSHNSFEIVCIGGWRTPKLLSWYWYPTQPIHYNHDLFCLFGHHTVLSNDLTLFILNRALLVEPLVVYPGLSAAKTVGLRE